MPRERKSPTIPQLPKEEPVFQAAHQTNNVVYILLLIIVLFSVYLFLKVRNLEQKIANVGTQGAGTQGQQASILSVDNLKKYAKNLGLNSDKFNKCLDSGEKKSIVQADINFGSSLGVQGTPGFFVNGRFFAGAFPFEFFKEVIDKEIAGTATNNCGDYSQTLQKYCQDAQNKAFDPVPKKVEPGKAPSEGASNPKVTIVEFSDFQCPFCVRAYPTVKKILQTYKNDVRLYYKQYPLTNIHPLAQKAAEASLCAFNQGQDKFWKYHDKLFEIQSQG
jgi:protein-disulfide isomerase